MRNIRLLLEYDGTGYVGWQRQASRHDSVEENGRSIQGEIESVLEKILQEKVNLLGAGRTDAGVHARGQVANFRTDSILSADQIKGGLNGLLPEDIVVHSVEEVAFDFHARYSAKGRVYSYLITLDPSAIGRNYSWYVKYPLDIETMQMAARHILGTHDFESFCKANSDVEHHLCTVTHSSWSVQATTLMYAIHADRFLHGMVRALVGTMVDVGRGYMSSGNFEAIMVKKDRKEAGMSAPARGLVLERVVY